MGVYGTAVGASFVAAPVTGIWMYELDPSMLWTCCAAVGMAFALLQLAARARFLQRLEVPGRVAVIIQRKATVRSRSGNATSRGGTLSVRARADQAITKICTKYSAHGTACPQLRVILVFVVTHRGRFTAHRHRGVRPPPLRSTVTGTSGRRLPWKWHWLLPVVVAASTAAWLTGVMSGRTADGMRIALMVSGALFTAVASGVPLWQQARTSRARADALAAAQAARAAMRIALQDALDPFTALLLQLATARPKDKPLLRGEAIGLTVTTIAQVSDPGETEDPDTPRRLRVCYFALEPGPPRTLILRAHAGRAGTPAVLLDQGTRAGQFLLRIADEGWLTIDDTEQLRAPAWWDDDHQYRTFAAGPVPGPGSEPAGLIIVDALVPGQLATLDLPLVRLLTHLLSLALQI